MTQRNGLEPKAVKTRKRQRAAEELYLAGYGPREIHDLIGISYGVTYGTIRNDIVAIRKAWTSDIDQQTALEGKHRYLASLRQLRRKVLTGYRDKDGAGEPTGPVRGKDPALAYKIDQDIARLSGVRLKSDERTLHLDITAARAFVDTLTAVAFEFITDPGEQEQYVARLDEVAAKAGGSE